MPRHGTAPSFSKREQEAIVRAKQALMEVVDCSRGADALEERLSKLLAEVGREGVEDYLQGMSEETAFEENGVTWRPALRDQKKFMTLFGWVTVERPLFRSKRNGPTRCLVSERAGLFQDKWTPRAAKIAALVTAELPFGRAEAFFREASTMAPSKTLLQRLDRGLLDLWELDRERHEESLRKASTIPTEAVVAVVSLDGVMVNMIGSERAETKSRALAAGRSPKGPAGYKQAAIGVITLYDKAGDRVATWRMGRMPETNMTTVKAWLRNEVAWLRAERPGLRLVAAADGFVSNWTFLKTLDPDLEVLDYFHAVEYISRWFSAANGPSTLDTQEKLREIQRLLLEDKEGASRAFDMIDAARRKLARGRPSKAAQHTKKKKGDRLAYLERHRDRMNFAEVRAQNIPIGTGVTEGTCRHLIVDRLRRSGMTWSQRGGQAVINLRALVVSDRFEAGWASLVTANNERLDPRRLTA